MVTNSIQDRTAEFRAVLAQAQKKQSSNKLGSQRQSLLTDSQRKAANGTPNGDAKAGKRGARSEFAGNAAQIGRGITGTMEKLERLAQRTRYHVTHHARAGSGEMLMYGNHSGTTENALRRPAGGNCRAYICHKARLSISQFADILTSIVVEVSAVSVAKRWCGAGGRTQQECLSDLKGTF